MPQIENVSGPPARGLQDIRRSLSEYRQVGIQRYRVHIALYGHVRTQDVPGIVELDSPVNSHHRAAGFAPAAAAEPDYRSES